MKKILVAILVINVVLQPLSVFAQQNVAAEFNPSVIVPDRAFSDTQTFGGPDGIQQFLKIKGSVLANPSPDFLIKLNEPNDPNLKELLGDPEPNLGRLRTAAELIWDAGQATGLNPQIILVTLNKEQGLIANTIDPSKLQKALNRAMGFDCPDGTGCGNLFPGFYYQLFGNVDASGNKYLGATKSLMKSFTTPGGRGPTVNGSVSKVGDTISIDNTIGDYFGVLLSQMVTLGNVATAALYRYTPHVFNGNYNFWKFFTAWFKYPNGTLLKTLADGTVYIVEDGTRQQVPSFVAVSRGLNLGTTITVSPTEITDYPLGPVYGPADNTIVNANGNLFVFVGGIMHPVTSFVLGQRKLDPKKSLPLSTADASLFTPGLQLTPFDGTVLRGETSADVYLVDQGILKLFSAFTLKQQRAAKLEKIIPDTEIALYPKAGYVIPLNGTLVKSAHSNGVYIVSQQQRLPLTAELFKNLGYKTKDIVTLTTDAELASIHLGAPATPREGTFFAISGSTETYLFKDGTKHPIFPFVVKQRHITADYSFEASIASNWPDGIAISPVDETLIKSNATTTVYVVTNGQLRPLTGELFKNLGLSFKNVVTLPDTQVSVLPKDGYATPRENTYFAVAETKEFYLFSKGTKRRIYPFVVTQRGMTPDYTFGGEVVDDWTLGAPVVPREGTLLEGDGSSTIYLVSLGKLRSLTTAAFKRRGSLTKNVHVISQDQIDGLPKGDPILK